MPFEQNLKRRAVLLGGSCAITAFACGSLRAQGKIVAAALFAGKIDDGGFMQAGYEGLMIARDKTGATVSFRQGVPPRLEALTEALRSMALEGPDLVIAHGGQNNDAAAAVAREFPKVRFAVTQGSVRRSQSRKL